MRGLIGLLWLLAAHSLGTALPAFSETEDDAAALSSQVVKLYDEGKYAEAEPLAQRALALSEKALGPEHPDVGKALSNLALLYRALGRYPAAEPLYLRTLAIREKALGPDHPDVGASLNNLALLYLTQGRFAEAEPMCKRSLAIWEKALGPEHPDVGTSLNNLAGLYKSQGRYGEAEPRYLRALAIREKVLGPEHPDVGTSLNNLAQLYLAKGRYAEAEPLYERALAIWVKAVGPEHPDVATSLNNLAGLYQSQGRYGDAESKYTRALGIREKALGPEHPQVATSLGNLAGLYEAQGRYSVAESLYKRALGIRETALGPDHPHVGTSLNNLAGLYNAQSRHGEAEPLYKRALSIREKALGLEHPDVSTSLNNLAMLYKAQGRYADAEPLYKRSLAIGEKALGPVHPEVATSLNNLAELYRAQGRHGEIEPLYKRSLAIGVKALGPEQPAVATSLNNLAGLYKAQGRYGEAEQIFKRALDIRKKALGLEHPDVAVSLNNLAALYEAQALYSLAEPIYEHTIAVSEKALGPDHPQVATSLNNLAGLYEAQDRYLEAGSLYKRSITILAKALGPEHPQVATSLNNLAALALARNDFAEATNHWRQATALIQRRAVRGLGGASGGSSKGEAQRNSGYFDGLVKTTHRLAATHHEDVERRAFQMFETAQSGQGSEAAASLAQMAARSAGGSPELAALVRERQDLVGEWHGKDKLLIAAMSELPANRIAATEQALSDRLAAIDGRLAAIDARLANEFPDYAALVSPKSISVADVQSSLREGEALLLLLDTDARFKPLPEETFVWVVTQTDTRWVRSELGTEALKREVAALRCGLDYPMAWRRAGSKCRELTGVNYTDADHKAGKPLPFDAGRAHALYRSLFGEVEDLIKAKHLLVVPSGPLTTLPFQVLVTAKPEAGGPTDFRKVAWLARSNPITVLPAVSSLKALRRDAKPSQATQPFIGYGNPMLTGTAACRSGTVPETCPGERIELAAGLAGVPRSAGELRSAPAYFRDGRADVAALTKLCPLPDTAHELKCVARSLEAGQDSVMLGKDMTEAALKKAPLDRYRILHFATHGLLSGEMASYSEARAEPALVMSPPKQATDEDDGLLTASEVAGLRLDADWVVMSACNTAAGDQGAEALSGLARAFFYAGARALLVSHWPVNSYATTLLTSRTFAEMRRKDKAGNAIGRSEALSRAMLALIDDTASSWAAHPSIWAPFVVVGEGGAAAH